MKKINLEELREEFDLAYNFLLSHDMEALEECRYELGNGAYVNVESYDTYKYEERYYESHRKYIDIQCLIVGRESIVVAPIEILSIIVPYDSDRDIVFYSNEIRGVNNYLKAGDMMILEPEDGHMPCVAIDTPEHVKKAVFKFPMIQFRNEL